MTFLAPPNPLIVQCPPISIHFPYNIFRTKQQIYRGTVKIASTCSTLERITRNRNVDQLTDQSVVFFPSNRTDRSLQIKSLKNITESIIFLLKVSRIRCIQESISSLYPELERWRCFY